MNSQNPPIRWRKSHRSDAYDNCVEVATFENTVWVRDSKNPHGPTLSFTASAWRSFTRGLRQNHTRTTAGE